MNDHCFTASQSPDAYLGTEVLGSAVATLQVNSGAESTVPAPGGFNGAVHWVRAAQRARLTSVSLVVPSELGVADNQIWHLFIHVWSHTVAERVARYGSGA